MNKWYEILYSHEIAQMPEAMRRRKNVILTTTIVSTAQTVVTVVTMLRTSVSDTLLSTFSPTESSG